MEKEYTTEVRLAKSEGSIKANVKVTSGILTLRCTLEEKGDRMFLNGPSKFVESLKDEDNTGFIQLGWIGKDSVAEVREDAISKYQELQAVAA